MVKQAAYPPEVKAAVLAALLAGQGPSAVARAHHVDRATVLRWRAKAGLDATVLQQEKRDEIGDLLLRYLRANLTTLAEQAEHFRDKKWLAEQDASSSAVLHGVLADKATRILETFAEAPVAEESAES